MTWDPNPGQRREPLTTAWTPGAPPVDAETVFRSTLPPAPPPPPPARRRRGPLLLAIAAAVVVVVGLGTGVGIALAGDDGGTPANDPSTAAAANPPAVDPASTPEAPATETTLEPPTSAAPTTAAPAAQTYTAPGGLTVQGPAGWVADGSADNANIRDFDVPGSPARLASSTFRIGIGNPTPSGSFQDEVTAAANFQVTDKDATIVSTTYTSFLGTTAGDIVYSYFNSDYGVQRQGVERIWRSGGVTLIIQSSDVATNWTTAQAVFQQLVTSARVG